MALRTVNEKQLAVLQWIADGCPGEIMKNDDRKTSAAALRTRRLVKITRETGKWHATITPAGQYFLEHHQYPEGHWPEEAKRARGRPRKRPQPPERPTPDKGRSRDVVPTVAPVDQLIHDLKESNGRLVIPPGTPEKWDSLISAAMRFRKAPPGYILQRSRTQLDDGSHGYVITAEPLPEWVPAEPTPIPVPSTKRRLHPAVQELDLSRRPLPNSKPTRNRALRILSALANEAEARGYIPEAVADNTRQSGTLTIDIHGHAIGLTLSEQSDTKPHTPTTKELHDAKRYSWTRIPEFDYIPNGRLTITINTYVTIGQATYSDTKRHTLENRLPDILREMELRAAALQLAHEERQRKEEQRLIDWQHAYDDAIEAAREEHRLDTLIEEQEAWHQSRSLIEYLNALEERIHTLTGSDQEAALEWLTWGRRAAQELNPLNQPLGMPEDPDFTSDDLKPHMHGFPPHSPRRGW